MKIQYQAPKGKRIKKQFRWLELNPETTDDWISWVYYPESNEWRKDSYFKSCETYGSSCCRCYSLKAAIRRIKKWNFPEGTTFKLGSIWVGYDIYITV